MNDNKKFSIRQYREALYNDIIKKKKDQRKKWQAKYLEKLAHVNEFDKYDLEEKPSKEQKDDENILNKIMAKNEQKYHRPVSSSINKNKESGR